MVWVPGSASSGMRTCAVNRPEESACAFPIVTGADSKVMVIPAPGAKPSPETVMTSPGLASDVLVVIC
jgi:hypothetical protein